MSPRARAAPPRARSSSRRSAASCHTLADAGTRGTSGPNLDEAFRYARDEGIDGRASRSRRSATSSAGRSPYPVEDPVTGTAGHARHRHDLAAVRGGQEDGGGRARPQGCVDDPDEAADSIAAYVASVAGVARSPGRRRRRRRRRPTGRRSSPRTAAAATRSRPPERTGTIGPNLDESKPARELVVDRVTNGKGAMPPSRASSRPSRSTPWRRTWPRTPASQPPDPRALT